MHAAIDSIEYYLPQNALTTADLAAAHPNWDVEKTDRKTGIQCRHTASEDEYASDLAVGAVRKLFDSGRCSPDQIDYILLCTQSPDYALPTTACILQHRLGILSSTGALDFNLGCSGYIYGLGLAEGLISSGQSQRLLLITSETYTRYLADDDRSSRTIFGDAAAVTLISGRPGILPSIGPFVYGTDGSGAEHLIVRGSGARQPIQEPHLHMNGHRLFDFAIERVPEVVRAVIERTEIGLDDVDLFVFHQANAYILEELRRILNIPREKFVTALADSGNTVSSTIPIALKEAEKQRRIHNGSLIMLVGFGVGFSWGGVLLRWSGAA